MLKRTTSKVSTGNPGDSAHLRKPSSTNSLPRLPLRPTSAPRDLPPLRTAEAAKATAEATDLDAEFDDLSARWRAATSRTESDIPQRLPLQDITEKLVMMERFFRSLDLVDDNPSQPVASAAPAVATAPPGMRLVPSSGPDVPSAAPASTPAPTTTAAPKRPTVAALRKPPTEEDERLAIDDPSNDDEGYFSDESDPTQAEMDTIFAMWADEQRRFSVRFSAAELAAAAVAAAGPTAKPSARSFSSMSGTAGAADADSTTFLTAVSVQRPRPNSVVTGRRLSTAASTSRQTAVPSRTSAAPSSRPGTQTSGAKKPSTADTTTSTSAIAPVAAVQQPPAVAPAPVVVVAEPAPRPRRTIGGARVIAAVPEQVVDQPPPSQPAVQLQQQQQMPGTEANTSADVSVLSVEEEDAEDDKTVQHYEELAGTSQRMRQLTAALDELNAEVLRSNQRVAQLLRSYSNPRLYQEFMGEVTESGSNDEISQVAVPADIVPATAAEAAL